MDNTNRFVILAEEKGALVKFANGKNEVFYFPTPIIDNDDVEAFLSVRKERKKDRFVNLHVRYYDKSKPLNNPIALKSVDSEVVIPFKSVSVPVKSNRNNKMVTRYCAFVPLLLLQEMMEDKKIVLVSEGDSRSLTLSYDSIDLSLFLASGFGIRSLSEKIQQPLTDFVEEQEEAKKKREEEAIKREREREREKAEQARLAAEKEEEEQREEQRKRTVLESWKEKQVPICSKLVLAQLVKQYSNQRSSCLFYQDCDLVTYSHVGENEIKKILNNDTEGLVHADDEYSAEKKEIFGSIGFSGSIIQNLIDCMILQPEYIPGGGGTLYQFLNGYTEQLGYDLIDKKTRHHLVVLKILANACFQNAIVYRKTSIIYVQNSTNYYYDCLRELGILSEAESVYDGKTLKWYRVLYVTDYQRACDIIDGKRDSLAKNQGGTSTSATSSNGCYIATCVYGSYDCPEVWTLRRYRDQVLDETWVGRLFIKTYYAVSPKLVQWFGNTPWFRTLGRKNLDRLVRRLQSSGFEQTPYFDKY